jgi:GNAT superfamily N-acetyltransferase
MGFAVADCHVYADNERVASFQMMKFIRSDNMLVVDSFIVEKAQRGQGLGKRCMHDFAAMLAEEAPDVRGIRFDLRCSGAGLDVPQMARALERLLSAIGARGIMLRAPNENTRVVSALWLKTDW